MLVGDGGQLRGRPGTAEVALSLVSYLLLWHLIVVALENDLLAHELREVSHVLVDLELLSTTEDHV